jgi:hypothetical protein
VNVRPPNTCRRNLGGHVTFLDPQRKALDDLAGVPEHRPPARLRGDRAIFFGCLGMFMYLFRGEMANRTLHYGLLAGK